MADGGPGGGDQTIGSKELTERMFRDATGAEWRVLEVRPSYRDRRQRTERRLAASEPFVERRRGAERRVRPGARLLLSESFQGGWLCFLPGRGDGARRRVAPIPPDWQAFSDHELARFIEERPADSPPDDGAASR
jgi:hypothetical protein